MSKIQFRPLAGLALGIVLSLLLTALAGENPLHIGAVIFKSAFGSTYDFGLTLFYTTSLIFTGLSVFISFRAGLFNLGAEGQLIIGSMATAAWALSFPETPAWIAPWVAGAAGLLAAGLWGGIAGGLRAWRGSHEVVVTMMLNFIAIGCTNWFTLQLFHNPESQNPETAPLPTNALFSRFDFVAKLLPESSVNMSLVVAVILVLLFDILFRKSRCGFSLKAVGENENVARLSGISVAKVQTWALIVSGAVAGFVGWNEVLGASGKFRIGFSSGIGFLGVAVALLAGKRAWTILPSALLFGALLKGAADLDMESNFVTRDFAQILQAVILLCVVFFSGRKKTT